MSGKHNVLSGLTKAVGTSVLSGHWRDCNAVCSIMWLVWTVYAAVVKY